jgi:hypothetical protein
LLSTNASTESLESTNRLPAKSSLGWDNPRIWIPVFVWGAKVISVWLIVLSLFHVLNEGILVQERSYLRLYVLVLFRLWACLIALYLLNGKRAIIAIFILHLGGAAFMGSEVLIAQLIFILGVTHFFILWFDTALLFEI